MNIERGAIEPDLEGKEAEFDPRTTHLAKGLVVRAYESGLVGLYSGQTSVTLTDDEAIAQKRWLNENF